MKEQKINEKNEERGLIVTNDISTSLLTGEETSKIKFVTSLDMNDPEDMEMLTASMDDVDEKLNEEKGKILDVIGHKIGIYERTEEVVDEETGEVKEITRKKHTLTLFTSDGKSHVTGSERCFQSYGLIVGMLKRTPSRENPMKLKVVEKPAQEKGHTYLGLAYVRGDK